MSTPWWRVRLAIGVHSPTNGVFLAAMWPLPLLLTWSRCGMTVWKRGAEPSVDAASSSLLLLFEILELEWLEKWLQCNWKLVFTELWRFRRVWRWYERLSLMGSSSTPPEEYVVLALGPLWPFSRMVRICARCVIGGLLRGVGSSSESGDWIARYEAPAIDSGSLRWWIMRFEICGDGLPLSVIPVLVLGIARLIWAPDEVDGNDKSLWLSSVSSLWSTMGSPGGLRLPFGRRGGDSSSDDEFPSESANKQILRLWGDVHRIVDF